MIKKTGIILIVFGIILSIPGLYKRIVFEHENKNVEIILESGSYVNVVEEYNIGEWFEKSWVGKWSPPDKYPFGDNISNSITLVFSLKTYFSRAREVMELKIPDKIEVEIDDSIYYIRVSGMEWDELKKMGMGIIIEDKAGLARNRLYIRPLNDKWVNKGYINWFFRNVSADGVIFREDEVLGYPRFLQTTKKLIDNLGIMIFTVEFFEQKGLKEISSGLKVSRLHSVPEEIRVVEIVPRVIRAVKERNIRAVYLKNVDTDVIESIRKEIIYSGFVNEKPEGYIISNDVNWHSTIGIVIALIGLALIFNYKYVVPIVLLIPLIAYPDILMQVLVILTAVIFPLAAIKIILKKEMHFMGKTIILFTLSIIAGFFIASVAGIPLYCVKLQQIRGIKLSLILPIILSIFIVCKMDNIINLMKKTVVWEDIVLFTFIVCVGLIYTVRSSNAGLGLVSSIELKVRMFLEHVFIYRPRFKEFLFGHPLLVVGLYYMGNIKMKFKYYGIFIVLGLVGQVSIINSFMHIHTPYMVSLVRSLWGMLLGIIFGVLLITVLNKWYFLKE